jgi:hypothetical protein
MNLTLFKQILTNAEEINFILPNGAFVERHFHITEIALTEKRFVDCGGTLRNEKLVGFQLWMANDFEHRLSPQKLLQIIQIGEEKLGISEEEIEVEYQGETIGKYSLSYDGVNFLLLNKFTACLAEDSCGIPQQKQRVRLSEINSCKPGSGCC